MRRERDRVFISLRLDLYVNNNFNTLTSVDMKTTQATVNLVLNAQRKNKDGLCPVVLRIFWKGRKDRQTDIYIPKSQWLVKEASSLGKKRTGGVITTAPALFLHTHEYFSI